MVNGTGFRMMQTHLREYHMDLFIAVFDAIFTLYIQSDIPCRHGIQSQGLLDLLFLFIGQSGFRTTFEVGFQSIHPVLVPRFLDIVPSLGCEPDV